LQILFLQNIYILQFIIVIK